MVSHGKGGPFNFLSEIIWDKIIREWCNTKGLPQSIRDFGEIICSCKHHKHSLSEREKTRATQLELSDLTTWSFYFFLPVISGGGIMIWEVENVTLLPYFPFPSSVSGTCRQGRDKVGQCCLQSQVAITGLLTAEGKKRVWKSQWRGNFTCREESLVSAWIDRL